MLRGADAWADFAGHQLTGLDHTRTSAPNILGSSDYSDYARRQCTGDLAAWHLLLFDHLEGIAEDLLDRLVTHPKLAEPELTYIQARRAVQTGTPDRARALMRECLTEPPGHQDFVAFAKEIGAR
ncbi:hypothetical protein [Actinoallomurus acaciae]|uniref:Uncharacterized protein n=1 Tax=Actinoallomurus acaciae TaxID=502577 RepID=A0ABV5YQL4_9ACTN